MTHRASVPTFSSLIARWRADAESLRSYGAVEQATAIERCAQDALAAIQQSSNEVLTPTEAAAESGMTADSITRLMRQGKLENVGKKRRPLVRRRDLPRKVQAPTTDLALLPNSANSGSVSLGLVREAISAKLPGGRRA